MYVKGTLLGTPNREPQEYSRNIMEYKDPGRYIPIIYLLYSWGSLFGVSSRVPLYVEECYRRGDPGKSPFDSVLLIIFSMWRHLRMVSFHPPIL